MVNAARLAFAFAVFFPASLYSKDAPKAGRTAPYVSAAAIIHELNLARENPGTYASFLEETRSSYSGNLRVLSGAVPLRTQEGVRAVEEAIKFLRNIQPQPPLAFSPGLCQAAADHCRDQAGGATGHHGSDRSNPSTRIGRYGAWQGGWAENIAYGQRSAREIVIALIIDDGVRSRGHRKNIFNASYSVAGAASGPHARFGTVCDIDLAGSYVESALVTAKRPLAAAF